MNVKIQNYKFKTLFILGPPGSGKGTQCEILTKKFSILHLSAGELLRRELIYNTPKSQLIKNYMNEGKIVPNEITCGLLKNEMEINKNNYEYFLVDGFPRNEDNFYGWQRVMNNQVHLQMTIDAIKERILGRSKKVERIDDKIEILEKRIISYEIETIPVIEKLSEFTHILRIDGRREVKEISKDIVKGFKYLI